MFSSSIDRHRHLIQKLDWDSNPGYNVTSLVQVVFRVRIPIELLKQDAMAVFNSV